MNENAIAQRDGLERERAAESDGADEEREEDDEDGIVLQPLGFKTTVKSKENARLIRRAIEIQSSYLIVSLNLRLDGLGC